MVRSQNVETQKLRLTSFKIQKRVREAYIWSKLTHPNVLSLKGFYLDDLKCPHFVSTWMEKGNLLAYLPVLQRGEKTIRMEIAEGLSYLHNEGIIHADLKSQNILIADCGSPLIMDFGISLIMDASVTGMCGTTRSSFMGTLRWSAIELFSLTEENKSSVASFKSDVWAFGMIVYELLTRKLPYHHLNSEGQIICAILTKNIPLPPQLDADSAEEEKLFDVCMECWTSDPRLRPAIHDIRDAIGKSKFNEIIGDDRSQASSI
ncbi:kinase-like protein [Schizopora paradoxa]|uniref:Kinase-like protein n=1 Tax=Schizopora paradoxa TaxID=27342 RepID=A0A0H2RPZ7_9AGAM|nr:kinase-like protein [Schizopora paradoxa]